MRVVRQHPAVEMAASMKMRVKTWVLMLKDLTMWKREIPFRKSPVAPRVKPTFHKSLFNIWTDHFLDVSSLKKYHFGTTGL